MSLVGTHSLRGRIGELRGEQAGEQGGDRGGSGEQAGGQGAAHWGWHGWGGRAGG